MKKAALIVILTVLLLGGGFFYVTQQSGSIDQPSVFKNSSTSMGIEDFEKVFTNLESADSYRVTITSMIAGAENTIVIDYDDPSTYRTVVTSPQGSFESIATATAHYSKFPGSEQWIKTEIQAPDQNLFDLGTSLDEAQENIDNANIMYEGKEACGTSTCAKYSSSTDVNTATLYIDTKQDRIHKIETTDDANNKSTMVFEYIPVEIDIPTNVQTSPFVPPSF